MRKNFLHLLVLGLLVLPLSAGAMYRESTDSDDFNQMQNRAQINDDQAEPMLLEMNMEENMAEYGTSGDENQNRWQQRVQTLKTYREARKNKKSEQKQTREQIQSEFKNFKSEMKDYVKERYSNWENTLDKKFDKWEARVTAAKNGENSEAIEAILTEISRVKEMLAANLSSLEASRQAISDLQDSEDQSLWVAEHQAEWQIHKNNLMEFKSNMTALNEQLRALKALLQ